MYWQFPFVSLILRSYQFHSHVYNKNFNKLSPKKSKRCRDGWMKLLANKVHIQELTVLLANIVHEELQC